MLMVVGIAVFGPLFAPYGPTELVGVPFDIPQQDYLLGTDALGRDVLSRFLWGGRSLVWMALGATSIALVLATALGVSAAYFKGRVDEAIMRLIDLKLAFPTVVMALLFVTMFGTGKLLLVVIVGLSLTPTGARVIRGAALSVVDREFIEHSKSIGMPTHRILLSEVLPNITSPLLVEVGLRLMWAISALAGLNFLGYGVQSPEADWGLMINENRNALSIQPWAVLAPIIAIASFTIAGNIFAEGIARVVGRTEGN
ncbi:peptide/nickel transport system permease protein [Rhizobium hainanense]|uniref:Peptide/nickel transport system permease protein n=2 Tax=Rhizobium hainanense TaxID=52131 RepID=A0A1C3W8R3_9HYPH|nr:peptide/nickel transport system permease protein [Rhizobium hainanense]